MFLNIEIGKRWSVTLTRRGSNIVYLSLIGMSLFCVSGHAAEEKMYVQVVQQKLSPAEV